MGHFWVADFNTRGELRSKMEYGYEQLERVPGASSLIAQFSSSLWRDPKEFETNLNAGHLRLRWFASADTAGIATLRTDGKLASLSLLASGIDAEADQLTLQAFQQHLLRELHDTGIEPAFGLLELKQRPLVATINFEQPIHTELDQLAAALADRCFAASYFRYQHLA
jgi:hypothetical protein